MARHDDPRMAITTGTREIERSDAPAAQGRLLRAALFYYSRVLLNGYTAVHAVGAALDATPDERVLDFACGCGWFCLDVPGDYLGIDLDTDYIRFARLRWGSPRRRFEDVALEALPASARFEKAIVASAMHHLPDELAHTILARLAAMVTRRVVVLDLDPEETSWIQGFLLRRDRGQHIRPPAVLRELLARHFVVREERRFTAVTRTVKHVLYVCEPRQGA